MLADLKIDGDGGFWYLASPYSKYPLGRETAYRHISTVAGRLLGAGVYVYCPISHTHPIAEYGGLDPLDHTLYLGLDQAIFQHAHGMLVTMMPGWDTSFGIGYEIKEFQKVKKPIHFLSWPNIEVQDGSP